MKTDGGFQEGDKVRLTNLGRPGLLRPVAHQRTGTVSSWESGVWVIKWDDGSNSMEPHYYLKHANAVDALGDLGRE